MKKIVFPQANNLDTVVNVFKHILNNGYVSKKEIASEFMFDERQADYYIGACMYLGLINQDNEITDVVKKELKNNNIKGFVISQILIDPIFCQIISKYVTNVIDDIKDYSVQLLKYYYPNYSDAVIERRTSTIINWINSIMYFLNREK